MKKMKENLAAAEEAGSTDTNPKRYLDTRKRLLDAIKAGRYPVGSALPPEVVLAAELGISRNTLRSALALLAEAGVVQRKKRVGTVVLREGVAPTYSMDISSMEGLRLYVRSTSAQVVEKDEAELPEYLRRIAGVPVDARWMLLSGIRRPRHGGAPVAAIDFYVRHEFRDAVESYGRVDSLLYEVIERVHGQRIDRIDVILRPDRVGERWGELLECDAELPAINMIEVIRDGDGLPMEVASLIVPQDRMQFTFEITANA